MKKKLALTVLSVALVAALAVGGTLAYLTTKTAAVKNTFTVGNVAIDLKETTTDYKMVPGNTISKDPKISVTAGSEASYLFVKVEESANLKDFISYTIADGWTPLDGQSNVYYREVDQATAAAGVTYNVLTDNAVTVKQTVTKGMMDEITVDTTKQPTLTFTGYAIQSANIATAAAAWDQVKNLQ